MRKKKQTNEQIGASLLREEAVKVAEDLVIHAKETARQMLLHTNLDVSQIPLICNKIVDIKKDMGIMQTDMAIMKKLVWGITTGIGGLFVTVLGAVILKVI